MVDVLCQGRGDTNGDHCCWINGQVCQFLDTSDNIPRCSMWNKMHQKRYKDSPIGQWMAENYPGKDCKDWPQNIPEVMTAPGANLCCWSAL